MLVFVSVCLCVSVYTVQKTLLTLIGTYGNGKCATHAVRGGHLIIFDTILNKIFCRHFDN